MNFISILYNTFLILIVLLLIFWLFLVAVRPSFIENGNIVIPVQILSFLVTLFPIILVIKLAYLKTFNSGKFFLFSIFLIPCSFFSAFFVSSMTHRGGEGFGGVEYFLLLIPASFVVYLILSTIIVNIVNKFFNKNNF